MPLLENSLMGKVDKVAIAMRRIREFEPAEGYYVAFSGGKDSIVIYDLTKRSGVKHDVHHHLTTVDPPELVQFLRKHYKEVPLEKPTINMWKLIQARGFPPTRKQRYCCEVLKERGGENRSILTGVRWAESRSRTKRRMTETCLRGKSRIFVHPIIDWTDQEVWEYIHVNRLPYCKLYDEGFDRLGCVMCPSQTRKGMERDAKRWPTYYNMYMKTFAKMLKERDEVGKTSLRWNSAEELMEWWMQGEPMEKAEGISGLFI